MKYIYFFFVLLSLFSLNALAQCYPKHSSYIDDHGKVVDEERVCPYVPPPPIIYQPSPPPPPQVIIEENNAILPYGYPRHFFYHQGQPTFHRNFQQNHENSREHKSSEPKKH